MATDILEALNELIDRVDSLTVSVETGQITTQVQVMCCEDVPNYYPDPLSTLERDVGDPPSPYPTWEAYDADLCKRAWSAVYAAERAMREIYDKQEIGAALGVGIIAIILLVVLAPFAVAIAIGGLLLSGVFDLSFNELRSRLTDLQDELMCAIYLATNATEAKSAIESTIDTSNLDGQSKNILKRIYNDNLITAVFDQTLTINPVAPTTCDCVGGGGILMRTAGAQPFNVVEIGNLLNGGMDDNEVQGWKNQNSAQTLEVSFATPAWPITEWRLVFEVGNGSTHVLRTPQAFLSYWTGTAWDGVWFHQFDPVYADESNVLDITVNTYTLLPNSLYRFNPDVFEFNNVLWSRDHRIEIIEP